MTDKEKKELVDEKTSLEKYIVKLKKLISSKEFESFNLLKRDNFKVQLEAMTVYDNTLKVRLEEVR